MLPCPILQNRINSVIIGLLILPVHCLPIDLPQHNIN
jgi:hypothetical protein